MRVYEKNYSGFRHLLFYRVNFINCEQTVKNDIEFELLRFLCEKLHNLKEE